MSSPSTNSNESDAIRPDPLGAPAPVFGYSPGVPALATTRAPPRRPTYEPPVDLPQGVIPPEERRDRVFSSFSTINEAISYYTIAKTFMIPPFRIDPGAAIRSIDVDYVEVLAQEIKDNGWLQNSEPLVMRNPGDLTRFLVVEGSHRVKAAQKLESEGRAITVPCTLLANLSQKDMLQVAYHSNRSGDFRLPMGLIGEIESSRKVYDILQASNQDPSKPFALKPLHLWSHLDAQDCERAKRLRDQGHAIQKAGAPQIWRDMKVIVTQIKPSLLETILEDLKAELREVYKRLPSARGDGRSEAKANISYTQSSLAALASAKDVPPELRHEVQKMVHLKAKSVYTVQKDGLSCVRLSEGNMKLELVATYRWTLEMDRAFRFWEQEDVLFGDRPAAIDQFFHEKMTTVFTGLPDAEREAFKLVLSTLAARGKASREFLPETMAAMQACYRGTLEPFFKEFKQRNARRWVEFKAEQVALANAPPPEPPLEAAPEEEILQAPPSPGEATTSAPTPSRARVSQTEEYAIAPQSPPTSPKGSKGTRSPSRPKRKATRSPVIEEPDDAAEAEAAKKRIRLSELEKIEMELKAAEENRRIQAALDSNVVFENLPWEEFFQPVQGFNKWNVFHKQADRQRNATNPQAFDLVIIDGPWGVNAKKRRSRQPNQAVPGPSARRLNTVVQDDNDDDEERPSSDDDVAPAAAVQEPEAFEDPNEDDEPQLRDGGFNAAKKAKLLAAIDEVLAPDGQVLIFCTEWQCGSWRSQLHRASFKTSTVPLLVTFAPSSSVRNRTATNLTPCSYSIVLGYRASSNASDRVLNLERKGFNCLPNDFPARSQIISGYVPPHKSLCLKDESGEKLRCEEKSVPLMQELILRFTKINGRVLDCFAGSASSAIACLQSGRTWVGCEKVARVHKAAKKRLHEVTRRLLLTGTLAARDAEGPSLGPTVQVPPEAWQKLADYLNDHRIIPMVMKKIDQSAGVKDRLQQDIDSYCQGRVEVRESPGRGKGLFAKELIPKGTILGYYWGDICSPQGLREIATQRNTLMKNLSRRVALSSLWHLPFRSGILHELNGDDGSAMAMMNCARGPHSARPSANENVEVMSCMEIPELRDAFLALVNKDPAEAWGYEYLIPAVTKKVVHPGQELMWDYGREYWEEDTGDIEEEYV